MQPNRQRPSGEERRDTNRPLRVLVADDDADTVKTLTVLLELEGHTVLQGRDGVLAVKSAIDLGKERLGKSGRLVIRPSGTELVIRVMAEGDDEPLVRQVVGDIAEAVRKVAQPA